MTIVDHVLKSFTLKQLESLAYVLNKTKIEDMDPDLEIAELLITTALHAAKGGINGKG